MAIVYLGHIKGTDGEGVPTGGLTGQVLAKHSNNDFDTEWVENVASSGFDPFRSEKLVIMAQSGSIAGSYTDADGNVTTLETEAHPTSGTIFYLPAGLLSDGKTHQIYIDLAKVKGDTYNIHLRYNGSVSVKYTRNYNMDAGSIISAEIIISHNSTGTWGNTSDIITVTDVSEDATFTRYQGYYWVKAV